MRATPRAALALLIIGVFLGGCGERGTEETAGAATTIDVAGKEYSFEPSSWTAAADTDVTVNLQNDGVLEHEWVVLRSGTTIESEGEFEEDLVAFETEAEAGESTTGTLSLPAGTYQVICAVPGHFAAGMEGELTLR